MLISDICKTRKSELKISNQAIADKSGITLPTVNNFFSQRSLAPSIYTVGPICRVLGVSLDEVFEIIAPGMGPEEVKRIKEESDFNQEELLRIQKEVELKNKESDHEMEMLRQKVAYQDELIAAMRDTIALLKEQRKSMQ